MKATQKRIMAIGMIIFIACLILFAFNAKENYPGFSGSSKENECGVKFPNAISYCSDFVGLFTTSQTKVLDSIISNHQKETTNQIAIVIIDSSMLGKCDLDQYTLLLARTWGVGQKTKNNGILIGIAPALKKIRIQNGYGIEKILSNEETKIIIDSSFIPEFKNARYFEGTKNGLLALIRNLKNAPKN